MTMRPFTLEELTLLHERQEMRNAVNEVVLRTLLIFNPRALEFLEQGMPEMLEDILQGRPVTDPAIAEAKGYAQRLLSQMPEASDD